MVLAGSSGLSGRFAAFIEKTAYILVNTSAPTAFKFFKLNANLKPVLGNSSKMHNITCGDNDRLCRLHGHGKTGFYRHGVSWRQRPVALGQQIRRRLIARYHYT